MALTPDDIVNYPLKQSVRGYSIRQVDELLDQVADELERLRAELAERDRRLARVERKADDLEATEATLRRTLVTAQRAAEETIDQARDRANEILERARREAEEARENALRDAQQREDELRRRYERLRGIVASLEEYESTFRSRLRQLLQGQLEELDSAQPRPPGDVPVADVLGTRDEPPPPAALEAEVEPEARPGTETVPEPVATDDDREGAQVEPVEETGTLEEADTLDDRGPEPVEERIFDRHGNR